LRGGRHQEGMLHVAQSSAFATAHPRERAQQAKDLVVVVVAKRRKQVSGIAVAVDRDGHRGRGQRVEAAAAPGDVVTESQADVHASLRRSSAACLETHKHMQGSRS
jgi:hypothetical protein